MKPTNFSRLLRYSALALAILAIVLFALGYISPELGEYWWVLAAALLAALFLLSIPAIISALGGVDILKIDRLEVAIVALVIANITVQLLGGIWGSAYPLVIMIIVLASIFLGFLRALILAAMQSALEFLYFYSTVSPAHQIDPRTPWAHMFTLLAFSAGVGAIFALERKRYGKLTDQYKKLENDVEFFKEAQAAATDKVLSELDKIQKERPKRAVDRVFSLDQSLSQTLELCNQMFGSHLCALYLVDRKNPDMLELRSFVSESETEPKLSVSTSQSPFGIVLREMIPLAVPKVPKHQILPYYLRQPNIGSLACAPIVHENAPLGVLLVDSTSENAFTKEQAIILSLFSTRIAETIVGAHTTEKLSSEREDFAAYYDLSKKLAASLNLEGIFSILLDSTKDVAPFDVAALVVIDETTKRLTVKAARGIELDFADAELNPVNSLIGWTIEQKRTLYIPDVRAMQHKDRTFVLSEKIQVKGVNSVLIIPLFVKNELTGVLFFGSYAKDAFDTYHQRLMEILANQAAVAVSNAQLFNKLEKMAILDGLTGLYNHRYFQEQLARELARSERTGATCALVLLDIDHFKRINDTYGHPTGDTVLKYISSIIKSSIRQIDIAARYGGEEFAIILPESDISGASSFAERLREEIESSHAQTDFGPIQLTISLGVSEYPEFGKSRAEIIDTADKSLYHAKRLGRNRTVCAKDIPKDFTV